MALIKKFCKTRLEMAQSEFACARHMWERASGLSVAAERVSYDECLRKYGNINIWMVFIDLFDYFCQLHQLNQKYLRICLLL